MHIRFFLCKGSCRLVQVGKSRRSLVWDGVNKSPTYFGFGSAVSAFDSPSKNVPLWRPMTFHADFWKPQSQSSLCAHMGILSTCWDKHAQGRPAHLRRFHIVSRIGGCTEATDDHFDHDYRWELVTVSASLLVRVRILTDLIVMFLNGSGCCKTG